MRLRCILLFAAAAAFATCSTDASSMSTNMATRGSITTADEVSAATYRRLRSVDTADELDEEDSEERGAVDMSKHADDMFKLLKLDDGVENLLANPAVQKWVSFVERMNKLKPENKVSILETLMKNYDDAAVAKIIQQASKTRSTEGLSRSLKRELLLSWSSANKSPATLLKTLKLDTEAKSLVTSPAVELLLSYVNVWNRNNPTKKTTLMNTIMTSTKYDEAMVAKAFQTAKQVKATKKMALQLQGFQFDRWMEIGYKPKKIIGVVFSTKYTKQEALIARLYEAYYKKQKKVFKELENLENAP